MREIGPTEAQTMPVLVDVREQHEWDAGHAPGAVHVPLSSLDPALVPAGQELALICKGGVRSAKAGGILEGSGFKVANVAGGMMAWQRDGLPVVTDSGDPGDVV